MIRFVSLLALPAVLLLAWPAPGEARDGRLRQSAVPTGVVDGPYGIGQRRGAASVLVATTRGGIRIMRSRDGRRFGRRVTLARPRGAVEDLDLSVGRGGRVLVAWTVDDGSIEADPESRDDDGCCTRLWVGGTDRAGRVLRPRRISQPGVNTETVRAELVRGRAVVTAAPSGESYYEDRSRVWERGRRGWSRGRAFAGASGVSAVPLRLAGRTVLVGSVEQRRSTLVRAWPLRGGRSRTLGRLRGERFLVNLVARGRRLIALAGTSDVLSPVSYVALRLDGGQARTSRLGRALLNADAASDGRGRLALAGLRTRRSPILARVVGQDGRPGRRRSLGRFGFPVARSGFDFQTTLSPRGTIAAWGTETYAVGRHPIVRVQRTRSGRVSRARMTLPDDGTLAFAYTDSRGRSVAMLERRNRLWIVG